MLFLLCIFGRRPFPEAFIACANGSTYRHTESDPFAYKLTSGTLVHFDCPFIIPPHVST